MPKLLLTTLFLCSSLFAYSNIELDESILKSPSSVEILTQDSPNITTIPRIYESRIYLGLKYDF